MIEYLLIGIYLSTLTAVFMSAMVVVDMMNAVLQRSNTQGLPTKVMIASSGWAALVTCLCV